MKSLLCALAFFCIPVLLSAQKGWVVDLTAGMALPVRSFEDVEEAEVGFALQAGATYRIGKVFALGMRMGMTSNSFNADAIRNGLIAGTGQSVRSVDGGGYNAFHFMLAPQLGYFGGSFNIALVPHVGIQTMGDLDASYQTVIDGMDVDILIDQDHDISLSRGLGLLIGTQMNEQIELSVFLNYIEAMHDGEIFVNISDGTTTVGLPGSVTLDYQVLQLAFQVGYRF
jgi:hypothetical protein